MCFELNHEFIVLFSVGEYTTSEFSLSLLDSDDYTE